MVVPTLARTLVSGPTEWIDVCRQAEMQGFHSVWTGDTAGADAVVDAAYAVAATQSTTVGIWRGPGDAVAAADSSGRRGPRSAGAEARLGPGCGQPDRQRRSQNRYDPVVARMRDFAACVTALLRAPRGEPVDEIVRSRARARGHGFGLDGDRLQVVLGMYGPARTALAGELTDGVLVHLLTPLEDHGTHSGSDVAAFGPIPPGRWSSGLRGR